MTSPFVPYHTYLSITTRVKEVFYDQSPKTKEVDLYPIPPQTVDIFLKAGIILRHRTLSWIDGIDGGTEN